MGDRTGLDVVVLSVLECLEELDARPHGMYKKSAKVVDHLYETRGIPPRLGYDAVCASSAPWLVHLCVFDTYGNFGSADSMDAPSAARYTECRPGPVGAMALASERGALPRLPIGLINGDLALGGASPPFDPARVIAALRAAGAGAASDDDLVALVGPPVFPTRCRVSGDFAAVAAGTPTNLRVSSDIAIETDDRGTRLLISRVPFGVGPDDVCAAIAARVDAVRLGRLSALQPEIELENALDLPLRDVRNESMSDRPRVVCELLPAADPELCRERILEIWPISIEIPVRLRAPLAGLVRGLVDDPAAQSEALAALLSAAD